MEIVRRELIDWENVSMTLHAERELSEEEIARLQQLLESWPRKRARGSDRAEIASRPPAEVRGLRPVLAG